MNVILKFFDKLEDHVRGFLSHYPIWYAIIGGIGIVLFWRGVWLTADYLVATAADGWMLQGFALRPIELLWWDGPLSLLMGIAILLMTGVFVSNFIGNEIIITGLRGDKKISEKTEQELRLEVGAIGEIRADVKNLAQKLDRLEQEMAKK